MKPGELFTIETATAVGLTFVGALIAFAVVYYLWG
jgi:hypothetical protein